MPLKKIFHKNIQLVFVLFLLGSSIVALAKESTLDETIDKIIKASEKEKASLVEKLKDDIAKHKYNSIESNQTIDSNISIDMKIKNRKSQFIDMSKCNMDRCGMGKCGMDRAPKQIIVPDDNISCGCE